MVRRTEWTQVEVVPEGAEVGHVQVRHVQRLPLDRQRPEFVRGYLHLVGYEVSVVPQPRTCAGSTPRRPEEFRQKQESGPDGAARTAPLVDELPLVPR